MRAVAGTREREISTSTAGRILNTRRFTEDAFINSYLYIRFGDAECRSSEGTGECQVPFELSVKLCFRFSDATCVPRTVCALLLEARVLLQLLKGETC